jgi:uracil-DNA glycosylase
MACRSHLKQEVEDLKPGLIIIMGSAGTKDVLGLKFAVSRDHGTFTVRGSKWDWSSLSPLVMVTYSPAFALFGEGFEGPIGQTIVADLTSARKKWEGIRGVDKSG